MEFINEVGPTSWNESRNENPEKVFEVLNDHFGIWSFDDEEYDEEDRYLIGFGVGGPA